MTTRDTERGAPVGEKLPSCRICPSGHTGPKHDAEGSYVRCPACDGVGHESPAPGARQKNYGRFCSRCKGTGYAVKTPTVGRGTK